MIPKIQKIYEDKRVVFEQIRKQIPFFANNKTRSDRKKDCLLYTSDAADD